MDQMKLNVTELNEIIIDLTNKKTEIDEMIDNVFLPIVKKNYEVYDKLGIEHSEEVREINDIVTKFDEKTEKMIYILNKKIAVEFGEVKQSILKSFNKEFMNSFNELMKK